MNTVGKNAKLEAMLQSAYIKLNNSKTYYLKCKKGPSKLISRSWQREKKIHLNVCTVQCTIMIQTFFLTLLDCYIYITGGESKQKQRPRG